MGNFIDWKTVAIGGGSVIVFLAGLLAGLWNSDDATRRHNQAIEAAEVRVLEQQVTQLKVRVDWLTDAIADQEQRIRVNERILNKLK